MCFWKIIKNSTNYVSDFCSDIPVVLQNMTRVIHETWYFALVCCDICEYICISSFECKLQNLRIWWMYALIILPSVARYNGIFSVLYTLSSFSNDNITFAYLMPPFYEYKLLNCHEYSWNTGTLSYDVKHQSINQYVRMKCNFILKTHKNPSFDHLPIFSRDYCDAKQLIWSR